jgi:hypothetical protein
MIVSGPFRLVGSRQTLVRARQPHQQRGPAGHANRFGKGGTDALRRNRPLRGGSSSPNRVRAVRPRLGGWSADARGASKHVSGLNHQDRRRHEQLHRERARAVAKVQT